MVNTVQMKVCLKSFVKKYGQDPKLGDLIAKDKLTCEVVHSFETPSCELHAIWRFLKGFKFAAKLYGTINFIVWLVKRNNPKRYIVNTIRSSAFLGTFIALDWYALCLARARLTSKLFPNIPSSYWDQFAPQFGSLAAGFSCFIEPLQRRKELSSFVILRALGTFVPMEETEFNLNLECLVFSLSFAVLVSFARQNPKKVRGLVGKGLGIIFAN